MKTHYNGFNCNVLQERALPLQHIADEDLESQYNEQNRALRAAVGQNTA